MQAEACVSALNELQSIFGVPRVPTLKELHAPAAKHTLRHLTAWLNPWLQLYELMPQLIHPDSDTVGDGASSEAGPDAANGVDEDKSASVEEGKQASSTDEKSKDRRVRLTYQQAQQVCCTLSVNEALLEHCVPCKMVLQAQEWQNPAVHEMPWCMSAWGQPIELPLVSWIFPFKQTAVCCRCDVDSEQPPCGL
jgi:hypothetical protein